MAPPSHSEDRLDNGTGMARPGGSDGFDWPDWVPVRLGAIGRTAATTNASACRDNNVSDEIRLTRINGSSREQQQRPSRDRSRPPHRYSGQEPGFLTPLSLHTSGGSERRENDVAVARITFEAAADRVVM
jgi:hypothetical protein